MKHLMKYLLSTVVVVTLGLLIGMLGFSLWDMPPQILEQVKWSPQTQWITPKEPAYRFYARNTFDIPATVQGGWLRISADNDFLIYVNGGLIALDNSTTNVSTGLANRFRSDQLQTINNSVMYQANTEPGLFYANENDWKVTAYIDLVPFLKPGKNVIAIRIQKSQKSSRFVLEGAVYPTQSTSIKLDTGSLGWRVSNFSSSYQALRWFDIDFFDKSWSAPKNIGSVTEKTYSRLFPTLFDYFLHGNWISGKESDLGELWLNKKWDIQERKPLRSFFRFAGSGSYAITINGALLNSYDSSGQSSRLHIYEVTNLLKQGLNDITVRMARPIDSEQYTNSVDILKFFLDGWIEDNSHKILSTITTDDTWKSSTKPISDSNISEQKGKSVYNLGLPDAQTFRRTYEGNAALLSYPNQIWRESLWRLAGILFTLGLALLLGYSFNSRDLDEKMNWGENFELGAAILLPSTIFLVIIGLVKHRYAQSEKILFFLQPQSTPLIFLTFITILLTTILWILIFTPKDNYLVKISVKRWQQLFLWGLLASIGLTLGITKLKADILWLLIAFIGIVITIFLFRLLKPKFVIFIDSIWIYLTHFFSDKNNDRKFLKNYGFLILIVILGFCLRVYNLDFLDTIPDENTSLDAIRGIIRTGAPESVSGIWYTRSPAYHYMVALWLIIVGDSVSNARFLSVLWGTATLVMVFILSRKLTENIWIALIITLILAIDPWSILYSRFIRFYQIVQFLCCLSFWLFIKGFIERKGKWYQYGFFIAITMAMLNQEVTVTILPGFIIGFLFFYKPFRLSVDWQILVSSVLSLVILGYDIIFFSIKCLTPWVALSTTTDSIIKPHILFPTGFISSLFFGNNRIYVLYSLFFLLGFVYFLFKRNEKFIFLYASVFLNLFVLSMLVRQIALRYVFSIYPLFIILAVHSSFAITGSILQKFEVFSQKRLPLKKIGFCCLILLLMLNIEPQRVLAGYQTSIARRKVEVSEYVRLNKQPEDVFISSTPPFAATTLGGLDYYLPVVIVFDVPYWRKGRVIDRWAGGKLISNVDQFGKIIENSKRVWIYLDDYSPIVDPRLKEIINYAVTIGHPVLETFGGILYLWEPEDGVILHIPNRGRDLGSY